ncbi:MAG: hypothetical protein U1F53_09070 [Burkholderiaceae bacterium]
MGTFARNGFICKRNVLPPDEFERLRRQVLDQRRRVRCCRATPSPATSR